MVGRAGAPAQVGVGGEGVSSSASASEPRSPKAGAVVGCASNAPPAAVRVSAASDAADDVHLFVSCSPASAPPLLAAFACSVCEERELGDPSEDAEDPTLAAARREARRAIHTAIEMLQEAGADARLQSSISLRVHAQLAKEARSFRPYHPPS
eukprot:GHVT01083523.1.p1 GENE.GHVT01083523.1~~GHVT01083523.1.p1  ORF type:complete len:153 (-),score=41.20 GHVT01083523.1:94-552(-)